LKYVDEYRDPQAARRLVAAIHAAASRTHRVMEVCGGQTHTLMRYGIDELLAGALELIHGPGCPVCVTPLAKIDRALDLAARPGVVLASFGDMLRVPGSSGDLLQARAKGADVRVVYSPTDALELALRHPDREVVLFAVGFETTAPANAMAVAQARREGLANFSLLVSHVLVPPAMEAILSSPRNRVQGFLAAGHVCAVMGYQEYEPIAAKYRVPIVVTGFEPVDVFQGIAMCVAQLESGRAEVENQYARSVRREGNRPAQQLIREVFRVVRRRWRGVGEIPESGLGLSDAYADFDAERRFGPAASGSDHTSECQSGLVLQGVLKPHECPAFATRCTPERPLGAPMVSSEGACAAYYRYRRIRDADSSTVEPRS